MKKMTQTIKGWRVHRSTDVDVLVQRYNATLRG